MRTNIELDDELMAEAQRLTGITVKRQVVEEALRLLVAVHSRKPLAELRGRIAFANGYDHKRLREST